MKAYMHNKTIVFFVVLFFFLSFSTKAQDTIYCPSNKYYWDNENCDIIDAMIHTAPTRTLSGYCFPTHGIDSIAVSRNLYKPVVLKQIICPDIDNNGNSLKEFNVYGIAGTPTACGNPNGCYYYLCQKIGTDYVIIDSAEWTHNGTDYNYVNYALDPIPSWLEHEDPLQCYPTFSNLTGAPPVLAAGKVPVYEAYFHQPISVSDTFYIGMNPNCVPRKFGHKSSSNWKWPITDSTRFSFSFYASISLVTSTTFDPDSTAKPFIFYPLDSNNRMSFSTQIYGSFFPIMEPAPYSCDPITKLKADSISYNSAYIHWRHTLYNTYYQMEYGEKGFQHGTGVFIDSIMAQEMWLNNLETNTKYEVYVRAYCDAEDSASVSPWRKVSFKTFDTTCAVVANPTTVYVQDKLARISWEITDKEEVSNCEMEWGESGFARGSGKRVNNLQDTTYLFRNLSPNTSYEAFIRTYCPRSDVYSPWIKVSFTTETSGIMEAESSPIEVHPNPTTGIVEIILPQGYENKEVHIYNIHGTLLQTKQAQGTKLTLDLSAYSDGVYIIKIDNYSTRIVKTK